jgi:hypothetical protein
MYLSASDLMLHKTPTEIFFLGGKVPITRFNFPINTFTIVRGFNPKVDGTLVAKGKIHAENFGHCEN